MPPIDSTNWTTAEGRAPRCPTPPDEAFCELLLQFANGRSAKQALAEDRVLHVRLARALLLAPFMTLHRIRAAVVGESAPGLERLLADVMGELDLTAHLVATVREAQIVFAVVTAENVVPTIVAARMAAGPVVALLPSSDGQVARRALDCGARACYALDSPRQHLSFLLMAVLMELPDPAASPQLAALFCLGPRARRVIEDLRLLSVGAFPPFPIPRDAEARLELAIRADVGRVPARPFRLGACGMLEVTSMRLDRVSIERLENAIEGDLGPPEGSPRA